MLDYCKPRRNALTQAYLPTRRITTFVNAALARLAFCVFLPPIFLFILGPLGDIVHPVLILTLEKSRRRWWTRICDRHPAIRPRDFTFMVDYDREADEES